MALPALSIDALPEVLAGPIVRRVERDSTAVWVALKLPRKVTLEVYASDQNGTGTEPKQQGTRVTARLGNHLHVVVVTATGDPLEHGQIYRYMLRFGDAGSAPDAPVPPDGKNLFDTGIVAASAAEARKRLVYESLQGAPTLPSFVTPPANPAKLRLFHASCRKPHGEGHDALEVLDDILQSDAADRDRRPQQLFLTGDQIYADDVADVLLHLCTTRGDALLGRPEKFPDLPNAAERLRPGRRQKVMEERFNLTSEHAKSHLATFAEFACMYLFAWSEVLWPSDRGLLDGFGDVYPDEYKRLGEPKGDMLFGLLVQKSWVRAHETLMEYVMEADRLALFLDALVSVRRALANTATYMVFDDHEVTDDWFLALKWSKRVTESPLGRRLLSNALAAYAVFQAWGNTPAQFARVGAAGEPGRKLLEALAAPDPAAAGPAAEIEQRVGLPTGFEDTWPKRPKRPAGALDWHYAVLWPGHHLVVLDTRTRRSFPDGEEDPPALLLADDDLTAMLDAAPDAGAQAVTIVVSPAPVIGYPLVEEVVQPTVRAVKNYEGLLSSDGEAWAHQPRAFEKFVARLVSKPTPGSDGVRRRRVVILSGDVHYGFAARLSYRGDKPYQVTPAGSTRGVIAQLTASSLKNEISLTRTLHDNGFVPLLPGGELREERVGWANPANTHFQVGRELIHSTWGSADVPWFASGSPAVETLELNRTLTATPEWMYRVDFYRHMDADAPLPRPGTPRPVEYPLRDRGHAIAQYLVAAANHDDYRGKWGDGKEIVGLNNLGELQFEWGTGDKKEVVQTLWWRIPGEADAAPLTRIAVPLDMGQIGDLYGGLNLQEGDRDSTPQGTAVYAGVTGRPSATHVRDLQADLQELGIRLDSTQDGAFGRKLRWAVRELQGYAKMRHIARHRLAFTRLAQDATAAATTHEVESSDGFPAPPFRVRVGTENVRVTAVGADDRWTVERGRDGTGAIAHRASAAVAQLDGVRWSSALERVEAPQARRYTGPVSGVVNGPTRALIAHWKEQRWRCPVVVEAWNMAQGQPSAVHVIPASAGPPVRPARLADNLWNHDEVGAAPRAFVRDFSTHYTRPQTRPADGAADNQMTVLGTFSTLTDDFQVEWTGPMAEPRFNHTWRHEAEMLPEHLVGQPLGQLAGALLSTFKVVRAVAEVEALGYFDGVNCYDHAFASLGPCHWTAGKRTHVQPPAPARELWDTEEGELWAYFSYVAEVEPAAYATALGGFGVAAVDAWGGNGTQLFVAGQRKYTSRGALQGDDGRFAEMLGRPGEYGRVGEYELFRTWHWFHRFAMAGRCVAGFRRRMWDMARIRIRDVFNAPWDAANVAATIPDMPAVPATGGQPAQPARRVRLGDVFTSERSAAMVYRWHIFNPAQVLAQGRAAQRLRDVLDRAANPPANQQLAQMVPPVPPPPHRPAPNYAQTPANWGNDHEDNLVWAIRYQPGLAMAESLRDTLGDVDEWPRWVTNPALNIRDFSLAVNTLAVNERRLRVDRGSFSFDRNGLPPAP